MYIPIQKYNVKILQLLFHVMVQLWRQVLQLIYVKNYLLCNTIQHKQKSQPEVYPKRGKLADDVKSISQPRQEMYLALWIVLTSLDVDAWATEAKNNTVFLRDIASCLRSKIGNSIPVIVLQLVLPTLLILATPQPCT